MILRRVFFCGLLLLVMHSVPLAYGAESGFHPYISLKEEYNDNLLLTSTNKKDDYITTVQPGIRYSNMDKQAGVDLDYSLGAVFYKDNSNLDYISHNASLNAKYLTAAHINFYLKEFFIRSDNPQEREYFTTTEENKYMLATETTRALYWRNVVAPTIEYQFGPENRLGVNYRNNMYRTESIGGQDSREDFINPYFSYWFDRQNGISLQYGLTYGDFETDPDLTGHMANARYTHRLSPKTSVFAEYTYSKRTFDSSAPSESQSGTDYDIHEPSVGMMFAIGPTLTASAQVGYFQIEPKTGSGTDGLSYKAELASSDPRTTYKLSLQGGYKEDFFTSENLGLARYHRLTGSLNHMLDKRFSIGCLGSVERAEFDTDDRRDTIWGIGGTASYMPLKWLTFSLEVTHKDRQSNIDLNDYTENRAMLTITATY
ncbi:MAG: outer membrane beta-barrel protein [Syntrophales bacterium]|nr:outer membrane beta-barrel protein [Syntrophales bacterium]